MDRAGDASGNVVAEASSFEMRPLRVPRNTAAAEFQQAARQTPPAPVEVKRTEKFDTPDAAAHHALARADPMCTAIATGWGARDMVIPVPNPASVVALIQPIPPFGRRPTPS
jgi:hypothetical protein